MASTTKSTPSAKPKQPKKRAFVQASLTSRDTIDVRSHDVVYSLTREMVHSFFDLPSVDVARLLKVCVTVLKHIRSWAGIDCWPYRLVNNGVFELTREQIVGLRRSVIERLEGGEDAKYPGVLPLLREADVLGLAFKSISAPTEYAVEARAKALALKAARKADSDFKDRGAAATKVVSEVFKRPVAKRRVHWMSTGTVCLDNQEEKGTGKVMAALPMEQESPYPPICPYSFARDCSASPWMVPAYPPVSDINDGINAFWPVMDDQRRLWTPELSGYAPMSAAEIGFVNGILED